MARGYSASAQEYLGEKSLMKTERELVMNWWKGVVNSLGRCHVREWVATLTVDG